MTGTLSTMALPDMLQWLSGASKSGSLRITNGELRKEITFQNGMIVSCSSNDPREFLGQFLLSQKTITEDQLRQAMETQRSTGVMLGKILLMVNAITEDELREMLTLKAQEALFAVFLWKDGHFEFEDGTPSLQNLLPLSVKVEDILLEGLRRYDELQVILQEFSSSGGFVLERTDKPLPEHLAKSPEVQDLLQMVDGVRNLTDIGLELRQSEFKVSRVAYAIYRHGCLAVKEVEDQPEAELLLAPGELDAVVDQKVAKQKFEEAMDLLSQAIQARSNDLSLKSKLEEVEAAFVERAYRHFLPEDQVLALKGSLDEMTGHALTPQEMFLLSRINGAWTVKDIVTIAPLREVEALRVLKDLRERGLVELVRAEDPRPTAA